jgi:hypothetical protein
VTRRSRPGALEQASTEAQEQLQPAGVLFQGEVQVTSSAAAGARAIGVARPVAHEQAPGRAKQQAQQRIDEQGRPLFKSLGTVTSVRHW